MKLTGTTRVVGIFGDPVAHSLSPLMQNAALVAAGIDAVYVPFHVTPAQLCDAIQGVRALGIRGVNLTIPHKEAAFALVDEVDAGARLSGAINTLVNENGRLTGYNTDGLGLLRALQQDLGVQIAGRRVLLLGAGGACRAALVALAGAGAGWIGVANRTRERAAQLVETLGCALTGTAFAHYRLDDALPGQLPGQVDLLVNTSALGLKGESFGVPVLDCVTPGGAVYDMVYSPAGTPLVVSARTCGLAAADGLGMLAGQGEEAFRLWFGALPPAGVMRRALDQAAGR